MLIYFKRYVIAVCAIAVALPVIASTAWPLITGQMMAASLPGLALEFALFAGGFAVGYAIFNRRANARADEVISLYNDKCAPEAFLREGQPIASQITFPCNEQGAWFMGFYAQACLDAGRTQEAEAIRKGLEQSAQQAKKPLVSATITTYLVPLLEKMGTPEEVQSTIEGTLARIKEDASGAASPIRDYLESQLKVIYARTGADPAKRAELDRAIAESSAHPMRLRVEYAWDEASAAFQMKDGARERSCLQFVVEHGGGLALVARAKERLSALS